MTWLAGVDGCPKGWFRICRDRVSGELAFDVVETPEELLIREPRPALVALDIPIGLPATGSRECDIEARALLGPRRSSVFPAPLRPALRAASREEASEITAHIHGKRVSVQAWAIHPKIRAVDRWLASDPLARRAVREVHPEVSFLGWNGGRPMRWSKKARDGRAERCALAASWLDEDALRRARGEYLRKDVASDDILDAIAALWTAHRIAEGAARTLPASPPRDETDLPMQIVF